MYPILYCLETVSITGVRDWLEKVPSIFPVNVNQNPKRCLKGEIVEHNSYFLQLFQLFFWKVYAQIIFFWWPTSLIFWRPFLSIALSISFKVGEDIKSVAIFHHCGWLMINVVNYERTNFRTWKIPIWIACLVIFCSMQTFLLVFEHLNNLNLDWHSSPFSGYCFNVVCNGLPII